MNILAIQGSLQFFLVWLAAFALYWVIDSYVVHLACRLLNRVTQEPVQVLKLSETFPMVFGRQIVYVVLATGVATIGELLIGQQPPPDQFVLFARLISAVINILFSSWIISSQLNSRYLKGLQITLIEILLLFLIACSVTIVVLVSMYVLYGSIR